MITGYAIRTVHPPPSVVISQ